MIISKNELVSFLTTLGVGASPEGIKNALIGNWKALSDYEDDDDIEQLADAANILREKGVESIDFGWYCTNSGTWIWDDPLVDACIIVTRNGSVVYEYQGYTQKLRSEPPNPAAVRRAIKAWKVKPFSSEGLFGEPISGSRRKLYQRVDPLVKLH